MNDRVAQIRGRLDTARYAAHAGLPHDEREVARSVLYQNAPDDLEWLIAECERLAAQLGRRGYGFEIKKEYVAAFETTIRPVAREALPLWELAR